jgi:hypothetical protein
VRFCNDKSGIKGHAVVVITRYSILADTVSVREIRSSDHWHAPYEWDNFREETPIELLVLY